MWYTYDQSGRFNIRHSCEHSDNLPQYGWIRHDGTEYGQQRIIDHSMWYGNQTLHCFIILVLYTMEGVLILLFRTSCIIISSAHF